MSKKNTNYLGMPHAYWPTTIPLIFRAGVASGYIIDSILLVMDTIDSLVR